MVDTAKLPAQIGARIVAIRGLRAIIDADLAELYGVRTKIPLGQAFTEHGAVMAATVLKFTKCHCNVDPCGARICSDARIPYVGRRVEQRLGAQDGAIEDILEAIRKLMTPPERPGRGIGFVR